MEPCLRLRLLLLALLASPYSPFSRRRTRCCSSSREACMCSFRPCTRHPCTSSCRSRSSRGSSTHRRRSGCLALSISSRHPFTKPGRSVVENARSPRNTSLTRPSGSPRRAASSWRARVHATRSESHRTRAFGAHLAPALLPVLGRRALELLEVVLPRAAHGHVLGDLRVARGPRHRRLAQAVVPRLP